MVRGDQCKEMTRGIQYHFQPHGSCSDIIAQPPRGGGSRQWTVVLAALLKAQTIIFLQSSLRSSELDKGFQSFSAPAFDTVMAC